MNTEPTSTKPETSGEIQKAVKDVVTLGEVAVRFSRVERASRYFDGRRESDVEHSFHLGLTAVELAHRFHPELDTGLVSLFSQVHDMPEIYAGDVWTFEITDEERAKKEAAEKEATDRLLTELPSFWADTLRRYEDQIEPEARFVRLVDKLMPAVINFLDNPENSSFLTDHKVSSRDQLTVHRATSLERLRSMFPEYEVILEIRQILSAMTASHYFPND